MTPKLIRALLACSLIVSAATVWASNDGYTKTKYPIVLVHGMAFYDDLLGISGWYSIPHQLRKGGAEVYVVQVSALNSTELRGEQLIKQLEVILASSGAEKLNLIGHSHGSPTARYAAAFYPEYVASITSVGGVNWGTPVADLSLQDLNDKTLKGWLYNSTLMSWARMINVLSGNPLPQSYYEEMVALSTEKALQFNQDFPAGMPTEYCGEGEAVDANGTYYFSWGGTKQVTNLADPLDLGMTLSARLMDEPNDGLVPACSTHFGKVIRDNYRMNHLDLVDQVLGLHGFWGTDPAVVYRQHANRLKLLGL